MEVQQHVRFEGGRFPVTADACAGRMLCRPLASASHLPACLQAAAVTTKRPCSRTTQGCPSWMMRSLRSWSCCFWFMRLPDAVPPLSAAAPVCGGRPLWARPPAQTCASILMEDIMSTGVQSPAACCWSTTGHRGGRCGQASATHTATGVLSQPGYITLCRRTLAWRSSCQETSLEQLMCREPAPPRVDPGVTLLYFPQSGRNRKKK
jgi:hypothetical protein